MRDRFNAFIARHDMAWELGMALLAIVYVAVGFAWMTRRSSRWRRRWKRLSSP